MATIDLDRANSRGARPRHTAATMTLARTMYGDGDSWTIAQITRYLSSIGKPVAANTVRLWVVPGAAEAHNAEQRARRARRAAARPKPTPILDRMRELRAAGVSMSGIAAVLRVDLGLSLTGDHVRYALKVGREPGS